MRKLQPTVLLLQPFLLQLLLVVAPPYAIAKKQTEPIDITKVGGLTGKALEALREPQRRPRRARGVTADEEEPHAAGQLHSTLEIKTAEALSRLSVAWATTWKPAVFGAAKKNKSLRQQAYKETAAAINAFADRQLEILGIASSSAAKEMIRAAVTSLKDAALILLSLPMSPGSPIVSQRDTPAPDPTVYDDPVGLVDGAAAKLQQAELQQLLLRPLLDLLEDMKAGTAPSPSKTAAVPVPQQEPKKNWAVATWRNALQRMQQLMP